MNEDGVGGLEYFWQTVGKSMTILIGTLFITFVLVILLVTWGFKTERFNSWCENNGGELREMQNVTYVILNVQQLDIMMIGKFQSVRIINEIRNILSCK